eukprot:scaffold26513_cov107-Isochrysis_galbana.AAC.3
MSRANAIRAVPVTTTSSSSSVCSQGRWGYERVKQMVRAPAHRLPFQMPKEVAAPRRRSARGPG